MKVCWMVVGGWRRKKLGDNLRRLKLADLCLSWGRQIWAGHLGQCYRAELRCWWGGHQDTAHYLEDRTYSLGVHL